MFKQIFCKHDWELISKETTKSNVQSILESNSNEKIFSYLYSDLRRYLIQIVVCKKCGKIIKFKDRLQKGIDMKKIIMLFIICLMFCSCNELYQNDLKAAEYSCKDHGGVFYIEMFISGNNNLKCNDGALFNINDDIRKSYIDSIKEIKQ